MADESDIQKQLNDASAFNLRSSEAEERIRKVLFPNYPDANQIARFFEVLGKAITTWQLVETALYEVYERAVVPERPGACGASFHALQAFNVKLTATHAAVVFALSDKPELLDEWDRIKVQANKKATRRNEFVHFSTYIMANESTDNDKIQLQEQVHDYRRAGRSPSTLRMSDITEITERFIELANDLRRFKNKIPVVARRAQPIQEHST